MKILVIAPMQSEFDNFQTALKNYRARGKTKHIYKVEKSGVGKANAASTAALYAYTTNDFIPDLVVVVGYAAGSLQFSQGDIVMPSSVEYHDVVLPSGMVEDLQRVYELEGSDSCKLLTGDSFVNKELSEKLTSVYGEDIVFDMETAAISQVFYDVSTPVMALKLISDIPQKEEDHMSFLEFVQSNSDFSSFVYYLESL